jgi:hypothetical protein
MRIIPALARFLSKYELAEVFIAGHEHRFSVIGELEDLLIVDSWTDLGNRHYLVTGLTQRISDLPIDTLVRDELQLAIVSSG